MNLKFFPGETIPKETPLWRYMKLSTFFLLLRGRAFIPLLGKLQEADPNEGRNLRHTPWEEEFWRSDEFMKAWDWLKEVHRVRRFDLDKNIPDGRLQVPSLLEEWRYQLGTRRCVWCWFAPTTDSAYYHAESMAMWNLYARDGVTIKTTLGQAASAVLEPKPAEVLAAKMNHGAVDVDLEHVKRPFVFKSGSYAHEKEVRLVFRVNAHHVVDSGLKVDVDSRLLLEGGEVVTSPYIEADEADAIEAVGREFLKGVNVQFRQSCERGGRRNLFELEDDLVRSLGPFSSEEDLPQLLQEL